MRKWGEVATLHSDFYGVCSLIVEKVKDLEIMTHKLKINGITIYQDFNCRFTKDYLLFITIVTSKGYFTHIA